MEKAALDQIAAWINAAQRIEYHQRIANVPAGNQLVSLEKFRDQPERIRAHVHTDDPHSFVAYIKRQNPTPQLSDEFAAATYSPAIFIDPELHRAVCIIDYGNSADPAWCQHQITLALRRTIAASALKTIVEKPRTQREIIEFFEDWSDVLSFFNQNRQLSTAEAIAGVRRLDLKGEKKGHTEDGDFKRSTSLLESVEIETDNTPTRIIVNANYFEHGPAVPEGITAKIFYNFDNLETPLRLRVIGLENLIRQEINEAINYIHAQFDDMPEQLRPAIYYGEAKALQGK